MEEAGGAKISEAARQVKASAWTLRALERRGLFQARRDWTGARRYSQEDIQKLREILFPSAEVKGIGR
ncbi:MAG TPA: MerR family transcriptional regulator [Nitrospirales bacterium]|nr:MerR family transcriptional regulator [Nitrospirales bacterium]